MKKQEALELLKEMQDNCNTDWKEKGLYDDPKRLRKGIALEWAMTAIQGGGDEFEVVMIDSTGHVG